MSAAKLTPGDLDDDTQTLQDQLSFPILLADRVIKTAKEVETSKQDCSDICNQSLRLSHLLRHAVRLTSNASSLYNRPLRFVSSDVTNNLHRAHTLLRKCRGHSGVLRQVFSIATAADFRKVSGLLESSIGDMKWVLSILEPETGGGANLALPPIASNDPILAWVWSYISTLYTGQLKDRVDSANELASLARDNDRNKKMIVEEGGVLPLLKLLKEGSSPEGQIAAANALFNLASGRERVGQIVIGIPVIVAVLGDSLSGNVRVAVAKLVARMAELSPVAQEELMGENVTRPLVSALWADLALDVSGGNGQSGKTTSIHSIVQMNKESGSSKNVVRMNHSDDSTGSSHGSSSSQQRRAMEMKTPELKLKVKVSCAEALWKLAKGSESNCRKITETKGLFCLANTMEKESGKLRFNCLMVIMEITAVAEHSADLRRAAFKTSSPAAKAVLDQLLRVIQEESDPMLQIPAIRSIGCLSRTFPARETRIMGPLVSQLDCGNVDVAIEAAVALGKFVSPDNFNHSEHSKAIIEFNGVPPLMKLLRNGGDRAQLHGLVLLCHLAVSASNSKALVQARALNALEGAARSVVSQHPELRDLFGNAIHHLTIYQSAAHPNRHPLAI